MSSLTPNQRKLALDIQDGVKNREIVFISGRHDGKTRLFTRVQENSFKRNGAQISLAARRLHPEDQDVFFVRDVLFPRSDKITISGIKRQIIDACERKVPNMPSAVEREYRHLMSEFNQRRQMVCLAMDNCELIPERGYTVLKHLNELRDNATDIGCAVLVAGELSKTRMPMAFFKRATEIPVGKINAFEDILSVIETHWPGMSRHFTPQAIERLQTHGTTLDMRYAASAEIAKMKRLRMDEVLPDHVSIPSIAKAA